MPRQNIPSYRLHKPTGQAIVGLRGKIFYLGKWKSKASRERYNTLIAEYLNNDCTLPPQRSDTAITVEELSIRFLDWAESYYLKNGKQTNSVSRAQSALAPLVQYYGRNHISEFGPLSLKFVRDKLIEVGLARKTINTRITVIKQAFKWGVENELVPPEIYQGLHAVAGLKAGRTKAYDRKPIAPVPLETVEATLPFMSTQVADMVRVQLHSGMRPGEVCLLRSIDIDRKGDVWIFRPHSHKVQHHQQAREVFLAARAQEVLKPYLERKINDPEAYLFSPADAEAERLEKMRDARKTRVQPSQQNRRKADPTRQPGKCWRRDSYAWVITKACQRAGVTHWCPLQLRHTRGTEIRERFGLEAAQVILGHSRADVTQIYAERDLKKAIEIMREIG